MTVAKDPLQRCADLASLAEGIAEDAACDSCAQLAEIVARLAGEIGASIEDNNRSFRAAFRCKGP